MQNIVHMDYRLRSLKTYSLRGNLKSIKTDGNGASLNEKEWKKFYMEMAKVMKKKNQSFWLEGYGPLQNQPIEEILFEQGSYIDPNDYDPTRFSVSRC